MPRITHASNLYLRDTGLSFVVHTHDTDGEAIVREMVRAAMSRLSSKRNRASVTKKEILKVLFKTKTRLPDGNPVKSHLAYYWYRDGPYSERVYACLDGLTRSGVVIQSRTNQYETYRLAPNHAGKPLAPSSDGLDAARRELDEVVANFVNVGDAVKETYQDAPYKWYPAYRLEFEPKFEGYCNDILSSRPAMYTPKDVADWLDRIVLDYPPLPAFIEHRRIVMDFAKMLHAVIESDPLKHRDLLKELLGLSGRIWNVFAYAVRLEHHDEYYDGHLDGWREKYMQAVDKLDGDIREQVSVFDGVVRDDVRLAPEIEDALEEPDADELEPVTPDAILNQH